MRLLLTAAVAFLLACSCGYVGEPLPPALNIPVPVNDLRAEQIGGRIVVTFTAPKLTTDGIVMKRLGAIELFVNDTAVAVAGLEPGPVSAETPAAPFAGRSAMVRVRVSSLKGKWSTWATKNVEIVAPLAPPADLVAQATAKGVRLRWNSPAPEFRILRSAGALAAEVARLNQREWIDPESKFGQTYSYQVEALNGDARSGLSAAVEITPKDTFPPTVPAGLTGVAGIGSIELAWDRSPEPDVAGYRVYRSTDGTQWNPVGAQTPAASYSDREVKAGTAYKYAVTAVDQNGNESARSVVVEIAAP
ncbi:MAG: hypothetical protein IT168_09290 [Bryobacterales bacterium]|nr:hypothetical protein [Bryobacterales bacterium]